MFKALIIDDESDARGVLNKMLGLFCPEVDKIYEAADGLSAIEIAKAHQPQIAFVDIKLRQENGLEVAETLRPYCDNIIFVTAYDAYAVKAFQASAVHYLLKPVDPEHLQEAIQRVTIKLGQPQLPSISLNTKNGMVKLDQHTIDFVKGEGNYCTFYCTNGEQHLVSKNLSYYANELAEDAFIRVHQSYLIRIKAVSQFVVNDGYFAILKSGHKLPISRRRKDDFLRALQG